MANIKVTPKTKSVKQRSWKGITVQEHHYSNVSVTQVEPHERVLVLNLGQLERLIESVSLAQHAADMFYGSSYNKSAFQGLHSFLLDLKKGQS